MAHSNRAIIRRRVEKLSGSANASTIQFFNFALTVHTVDSA